MLLLAESGATHSRWALLLPDGDVQRVTLNGFNPNYHAPEELLRILNELIVQIPGASRAGRIVYYGSGCATSEKADTVKKLLSERFPLIGIEVHGDLLAVARGMLGQSQGIAAILGTGSNAGLYDGRQLLKTIPSLGYIMGDYGSASHLGRLLVQAYMRHAMPANLAESFEKFAALNHHNLVAAIYSHPSPGNFLASLAPFLSEQLHNSWVKNIVTQSFGEFLAEMQATLGTAEVHAIAFSGAVAHHFAPLLEHAVRQRGINTPVWISASPFDGLIQYHRKTVSE
ncbi:MAG: hypothetical protein IPM52_00745 [Bacteroidetes bacterium]|nr:hypothetical protein [Bacteroidota bacterium]